MSHEVHHAAFGALDKILIPVVGASAWMSFVQNLDIAVRIGSGIISILIGVIVIYKFISSIINKHKNKKNGS